MTRPDAHNADKAAPWTGCVHCGQTLPHEGTSWRESSRCSLFQRIAEQAWDEGMRTGTSRATRKMSDEPSLPLASAADNPYRRSTPVQSSDGGDA